MTIRPTINRTLAYALLFCSALRAELYAQSPMLPAPRPTFSGEFSVYPATPPGQKVNTEPEQWYTQGGETFVRNVTVPTLIPVLPEPAKATGAAVLVAPGGAFMLLSMDNEGLRVAHAFADRGIAAFVLKYRLDPTPRDFASYEQALGGRMAGVVADQAKGIPPIFQPLAIDDAAAALRLIRSRAAEWKIDPNRTGVIGFSAGAMTALQLTLEDRPGARPGFAGILYGPMLAVKVPSHAPPLFAAVAADDPLFGHEGLALVESWQNAGFPVELHFYEHGGHGFGTKRQDTTSDLWFEEFVAWLRDRGLLSITKT